MTSLSSFRIGLDVIIILMDVNAIAVLMLQKQEVIEYIWCSLPTLMSEGCVHIPPVIHVVRVSWKTHSPQSLGSGRNLLCIFTTDPAQKETYFTYMCTCTYTYLHTHTSTRACTGRPGLLTSVLRCFLPVYLSVTGLCLQFVILCKSSPLFSPFSQGRKKKKKKKNYQKLKPTRIPVYSSWHFQKCHKDSGALTLLQLKVTEFLTSLNSSHNSSLN